MKKKLLLICCAAMLVFLAAGCGEKKELTDFAADMQSFCDNISNTKASIEMLDPASENGTAELLACIDAMAQNFQYLDECPVPDTYPSVEDLATEANAYMQEAASLYHQLFESEEPIEEASLEIAEENYSRAIERVGYISSLLQGETPEGDNITVTTEEHSPIAPVEDEIAPEDGGTQEGAEGQPEEGGQEPAPAE